MQNTDLLAKARLDLADDMKQRGYGAVIWDNSTAGFQFIPEINLATSLEAMPDVTRVMGLYLHNGTVYAIEEDKAHVDFNDLYDSDTEVRPTVVTLSPSMAAKILGNPSEGKGFTSEGSLEEWLTIVDAYYTALNEAAEE